MNNHSSPPTPPDDYEPLSRLEEQLLREERRLAEVVLRRTKLLADIAVRKRDSKRRGTGQELEKALWRIWENVLQPEQAGHSRNWRQLLAQCNNLGYALGEQKSSQKKQPWLLRPIAPAKAITLAGPADIFSTKILIFWAAATNSPIQLHPVVLNDGLIELIKSLNQIGAGLSWEEETITHTPNRAQDLDFEQKTIHAGQNAFTLALMLALALARPGIAKFSGSGALNMLHLKPWQAILPKLGARLHQLNPHAPGLPVRLESNGRPEHAEIGADFPIDLLWALLAAAPFYPQGLHLSWTKNLAAPELETITLLYAQFGIPHTLLPNGIRVSPTLPRLPEQPRIPLDITLNSLILAWSRMTGRQMLLQGSWPGQGPVAEHYLNLLRICGVHIDVGPDRIQTSPQPWPEAPTLNLQGLEQALPLAVTLALSAPKGCMIAGLPEICGLEVVDDLVLWTGRKCQEDDSGTRFIPVPAERDPTEGIIEAPDSLWAMALAMLSFRHPGVQLTNPGELTTLWPGFWPIYNNVLALPKKRIEDTTAKKTESHAHEPARTGKRRVKI